MSSFQKKTIMWPLTLGVLVLLTMPSVWAQSSAITGTVTDATQAVLPGVEVEQVRGGQPYYHYLVSIE